MFYNAIKHQEDADEMANSVGPNRSTPLESKHAEPEQELCCHVGVVS